jgi:Protein of Unknown function (DUF2784)
MIWSLIADALVLIHFAFTAFVIFGGLLTWRWRWTALLHLPALAWGCWVEVSHSICPLTPLENHFRQLGGEAGFSRTISWQCSTRRASPGTSSGCSPACWCC